MISEFKLSHRATTLPGADPETDRVVVCNGRTIARVRQIESGQPGGLWAWSCYWVGDDTRGTAETLADGLAEVKARVSDETLAMMPPHASKRRK